MRTPGFWHRPAGLVAWALWPLGRLYAALTARRVAQPPRFTADVPVICVGNLNAGGTGKTPMVIALLERLGARGIAAHVVSRGYGGSETGPLRVDQQVHDAAQVGDEPLLLASFAPVWVARDRAAGARAAQAAGAQAIILDDGFQNPGVARDLNIVVVDARRGFGNGLCIPAGPLREPVARGLARADLLVSIGKPADQEHFINCWGSKITLPHITGAIEPIETGMQWQGLRALAFAGIGHPEKFFATLSDIGAVLVETHALDDHQPLSTALLGRLSKAATQQDARLVTTEKDAMRLPPALRSEVLFLPVRLIIQDSALDPALDALFRSE